METWRKLISSELEKNGEAWGDVVALTLSASELDIEFDAFYNSVEGTPFYLWTANYVYFSAQYDGEEWCSSVPRHPRQVAKPKHVGGDSMNNDIEGPLPDCIYSFYGPTASDPPEPRCS